MSADRLLVHNVFFLLKDRTPENRQTLIDACRKYLPNHPGIDYFAVGPLCESLARDVNDLSWDVGLTIVFADLAAHDHYQDTPTHNAFIAECKSMWAGVRVFDSYATRSATP